MKNLFLILLCVLGIFSTHAQYLYGLDPLFANSGIYQGDTGEIKDMIVQPDGKIVITDGEIKYKNGSPTAAMRFNSDGSIDSSFATNGRFFIPLSFGYSSIQMTSLCLQPDGKIIVAGSVNVTSSSNEDLYLIRLNANGEFDSSFGTNGSVITGLGGQERITSIALQSDGKIVICGDWLGFDNNIFTARYQTNGTLDSSFGTNGMIWSGWNNWGFTYPSANDIAVMPDGRIVVGGYGSIDALGGATAAFAIRLQPDGSLDTFFNHTGLAYTQDNLPGLLYAKAMSLQPDGKVLLGVYADSIAIVRFDTSGQLDNSFGTNGLIKLDPAGKVWDMLLQPDGKILLATNPDAYSIHYDSCYAIYRVTPGGAKDTGFGIKGRVQTRISNEANMLGSIALQPDGKLLAGGFYKPVGTKSGWIMLARYMPDATVSVSMTDLENDIAIYPNPANDYIYFDPSLQRSVQQLALYSSDGKLLLTQTFPRIDRLATAGLANGIYYLKLNLANHQHLTKKIIIQKN